MSDSIVLLHTAIAIILVILLLVKWRINPGIGLILGAIYLGIATLPELKDVMATIVEGFGNIMRGVGLVIGFGILLGSLLYASGGAHRIAESILHAFGQKNAPAALTAAGLSISTPVFYDVGYVITTPIAKTIASKTAYSIAILGAALVIGLGIAHTFIPPTPGPLAGAEILGVSLGEIFLYGAFVSILTAFISLYIYIKIASRPNFWNKEKDEDHVGSQQEIESDDIKHRPSLFASLVPILLPIILILSGTFSQAFGFEADWLSFISDKNTALLIGLLSAYWLAKRVLSVKELNKALDEGMKSTGVVLLITGAGGSFAAVIQSAGVGDIIGAYFSQNSGGTYSIILLVWLIAGLLRGAQGSGTVAMITAASIVAPAIADGLVEVAPVLVALAAFSGTLIAAHINDSGFWITTKLLGLSTTGGLKVYTIPCAIVSIISLVIILILNTFFLII